VECAHAAERHDTEQHRNWCANAAAAGVEALQVMVPGVVDGTWRACCVACSRRYGSLIHGLHTKQLAVVPATFKQQRGTARILVLMQHVMALGLCDAGIHRHHWVGLPIPPSQACWLQSSVLRALPHRQHQHAGQGVEQTSHVQQ
jgi:hypothetical protein